MQVDKIFPSNYLKAADLEGKPRRVTMKDIEIHKLGEDERPILFFKGATKGLVLNKTNTMMIASKFGDETDDWHGNDIELHQEMVNFQGKMVEAIRVRHIVEDAKEGPVPF